MTDQDYEPTEPPEAEPTDEQMERITHPDREVDDHRAWVRREEARIRATGRVPTLRDTFDPRFDGPW